MAAASPQLYQASWLYKQRGYLVQLRHSSRQASLTFMEDRQTGCTDRRG
jgi:hypothetical protein